MHSQQHTDRTSTREVKSAAQQQQGEERMVHSMAPPALQLAATATLPTEEADREADRAFLPKTEAGADAFQLRAEPPVAPLSQEQPFQLSILPGPTGPGPAPIPPAPFPHLDTSRIGEDETEEDSQANMLPPELQPSPYPTVLPPSPTDTTQSPLPTEGEEEAEEASSGTEPAEAEADPEAPSGEGDDAGAAGEQPTEAAEEGGEESETEEAPAADGTGPVAGDGAADAGGDGAQGDDTPASAEDDPNFQSAKQNTQSTGKDQKSHAPASQEAGAAQSAAVSPSSEVKAEAQGNQMGEMQAAETPVFDKAAFKAKLMKRIEESAPKTLADADNFKNNNKLGQVKGEMGGMVSDEKEDTEGPMEETAAAEPDTGAVTPRESTTLPEPDPGAQPSTVGARSAVPPPRTQAQVEQPVQEGSQSLDDEMAEAEVTETQLEGSNEPQFQQALGVKQEAQQHAEESPAVARQEEQSEIQAGQEEAQAVEATGLAGMHSARTQAMGQLSGDQQNTKSKDEQKRAEIAGKIDQIYQKAKADVEKILTELDTKVEQAFDEGANAAQQAFEDYVDARMSAYKRRRYSGLIGAGRWVKDKLLGMPSEVNVFYAQGRKLYLKRMDGVIDHVVNIIGAELTRAKNRITEGKAEVSAYVAQLPQDLQQVGQEAANDIQSKFDSLESEVDSKQDELIDSLANKYNERLSAIDARIEEMKAANAGLVDKALGAIKAVIETIKKLRDMILNVLKKAAGVIKTIISDPIGFLGNLIKGIGQGLKQFGSNILKHLKAGFIGWLTGAIGGMGLQIPDDVFSLKGMFSLVLQILGISWAWVRQKAVKLFGEPIVKVLEGVAPVFKFIMNKDWAGLWEYVKGKFNDLKSMVIDAIQDLLIEKVLQAGIKWIMGLLNPAGAFVKACMLIYDIVMFFVNNGSKIISLVTAVLDGISAVAAGNVSVVANKIEQALGTAIPIAIDFLASLIGLGGIADKVKKIIGSVREKFNNAIDWVLKGLKKMVKGIVKKLGFGKKGDETKDQKNQNLSLEEAGSQIRDRVQGEAPSLKGKSNAEVGQVMASMHERESKWLKDNIDPEIARKKPPKLLLIPQEDQNSWWIDIKINPIYHIPKQEKGTAGSGREGATEYIGMFHGSQSDSLDLSSINMELLSGRGGDGTGLELGSGLYLSHYYNDAKGYIEPVVSRQDDENRGWLYHIAVPKSILQSAGSAQKPDPGAGDNAWAGKGDVVKGEWKHIGSNSWKAGYQWVIKSEDIIKNELRIIERYRPLAAADRFGRGKTVEYPALYRRGGERPYSDQEKSRLAGIGSRRGYGESEEPQETGTG